MMSPHPSLLLSYSLLETEESPLVRFFYYINIITAVGLFYLFKRSYDARQVAQRFLNQLSKESKDWVELPGLDT